MHIPTLLHVVCCFFCRPPKIFLIRWPRTDDVDGILARFRVPAEKMTHGTKKVYHFLGRVWFISDGAS